MCTICKKVKTLGIKETLKLMEAEIKAGRNPEHFKAAIDIMLGFGDAEQDPELDKIWENNRRR